MFYFIQFNLKLQRKTFLWIISFIFFYGIDSKLGLWAIFENLIQYGFLKYILSIIFSALIIILFNNLINKDVLKIKRIFSLMIVLLFFNYFFEYVYHSKKKR